MRQAVLGRANAVPGYRVPGEDRVGRQVCWGGQAWANTQYCLRRALGCPGAYNLLTTPRWKPRPGYSLVSLPWALSSCTVYPVLQGPEVRLFPGYPQSRGKKEKVLWLSLRQGFSVSTHLPLRQDRPLQSPPPVWKKSSRGHGAGSVRYSACHRLSSQQQGGRAGGPGVQGHPRTPGVVV